MAGEDGPNRDNDNKVELATTEFRYFDQPNTILVTYTIVVASELAGSPLTLFGTGVITTLLLTANVGLSTFSAQEIDAVPQLSNVSTTGAEAGQLLMYNTSNTGTYN